MQGAYFLTIIDVDHGYVSVSTTRTLISFLSPSRENRLIFIIIIVTAGDVKMTEDVTGLSNTSDFHTDELLR